MIKDRIDNQVPERLSRVQPQTSKNISPKPSNPPTLKQKAVPTKTFEWAEERELENPDGPHKLPIPLASTGKTLISSGTGIVNNYTVLHH
jgi:hypothetical protein